MHEVIQNYLDNTPEERQGMVLELHDLITSVYPQADVDMKYKMPTYQVGEGWVAVANQKNYVSLYTCSAQHIEQFKARHPHIKTGKGCINFKPNKPLPLDDIADVVKHAIEQPKGH
ncbi:MAG: DUF1801 domain-containing protein [Pseudomonadota bacterium]